MTMHRIGGSFVENKASGGKWLVSESIFHIVSVYIYCSGADWDEVFKVKFYQMVEYQYGLVRSIQMRSNLEETYMQMR